MAMELCPSAAPLKKTQRYDSSILFIYSLAYTLQNPASEHAHPEAQHGTDITQAAKNGVTTVEDSQVRNFTIASHNSTITVPQLRIRRY